ncbi:MAG: lipoprotein [Salaquimonas sp.]|jgi:predicted small lipoprotein YifL|nr:lipoprotein [Salaquimonas sp.]
MTSTRLPVFLTLLAVLLSGLAVSGCGRRGGLEPPPSATVVTTDEQGRPVETQAEPVDQPFILDPLIQ